MSLIAEYILNNYYAHYKGNDPIIPTKEQIDLALDNHPDKVVILRDKEIDGVAVFLTLSDETYASLGDFDIRKTEVLVELLHDKGRNIHFILLAAKDLRTIIKGLKSVIKTNNPETVSWWNPSFTKLHRYRINRG